MSEPAAANMSAARRVLLVSNDGELLNALDDFLRATAPHVEVCKAGSRDEALRILAEAPSHFLVADRELEPEMLGGLLRHAMENHPDTRCVVLGDTVGLVPDPTLPSTVLQLSSFAPEKLADLVLRGVEPRGLRTLG